MKMIAVHLIQRRDAQGKRVEVAPRQEFESEGAEADFLLRSGAARKAGGTSSPSKAPPEPVAEKKPAQAATGSVEGMTKAELVKYAADNGIEIDEKGSKQDILDTITADQTAGDDLV